MEWISVYKELPKKGKVVLALGDRSATTGKFQGAVAGPEYWKWRGNTTKHVTHWMVLPPRPGKEKDDG